MVKINDQHFELNTGMYEGSKLIELAKLEPDQKLLLDIKGDVDIPITPQDLVYLTGNETLISGKFDGPDSPNSHKCRGIVINGETVEDVFNLKLTGLQIKELLFEDCLDKALYVELENEPDYIVDNDASIVLNQTFGFLLVTKSVSESDIPDLEECACKGEKPPKHEKYKIKVDKQKHKVNSPRLTGREILQLAGYDESRYLYQKFANGERRQIELDEKVDFTEPGIERFHTMRCEHQEGFVDQRQDFQLSLDDTQFLNSLNLKWECVIEGNIKRVVIYGFKLPVGFNYTEVDLNFQITDSYPTSQIDMAYFYPAIERNDGKPIRCITNDTFDGKIWQRWSRHRTPHNPWEPGVDCIATHVAYIETWFTQELDK